VSGKERKRILGDLRAARLPCFCGGCGAELVCNWISVEVVKGVGWSALSVCDCPCGNQVVTLGGDPPELSRGFAQELMHDRHLVSAYPGGMPPSMTKRH
jgi:hypothetical protein